MVLMLAAVLIVSLLIFRGYSSGVGGKPGDVDAATPAQLQPVERVKNIEPLLQEAAEAQRKAIEQQQQ